MPLHVLPARRVRFRDLLFGVARRAGLAPDSEGLSDPVAAEITEALNTCYKIAWEYYDWPETIPLVKVFFASARHDPPSNVIAWHPNNMEIANVHGLYEVCACDPNPDMPSMKGPRIDFHLTAEGIIPTTNGRTELLIEYKKEASQFSHVPWSATRPYYQGEVVYNPEDGCCYKLLIEGPAVGISVDEPQWAVQLPLKFLAEAVKAGGHAGFERSEEQHVTAALLEGSMAEYLDHEIDQMELHGNGTVQRRTSGRRR